MLQLKLGMLPFDFSRLSCERLEVDSSSVLLAFLARGVVRAAGLAASIESLAACSSLAFCCAAFIFTESLPQT